MTKMPAPHPQYVQWLKKEKLTLSTQDGRNVEVWDFDYQSNDAILSEWAKHFRNMYCDDKEIDSLKAPSESRKDFLLNNKFPDSNQSGAKIRSGDFGELLVADLLEYLENYWVPRTRYDRKIRKNTSTFGCDVIAMKQQDLKNPSSNDEILVVEVKAQFNQRKSTAILPRLQDALEDSKIDPIRRGESLVAIKARLKDTGEIDKVKRINRFQELSNFPCIEKYGAAACFTDNKYDTNKISKTDGSSYPANNLLRLLVIKGKNMMDLVNALYERAADEA